MAAAGSRIAIVGSGIAGLSARLAAQPAPCRYLL